MAKINSKIILEAMIDSSSLSNMQKQVAKKRLKVNADISVVNFAKSRQEIEKQIENLASEIKNILGNAISDRQAVQWAKQYYNNVISSVRQAEKERQSALKESARLTEQLEKSYQSVQKLESRKNSLNNSKNANKTAKLDKQIRQATNDYHSLLDSSKNMETGALEKLKTNWKEQGIFAGEFKTKVEQLETSLKTVGSKGELDGLKTQIETLKTEAAGLAEVRQIQFSIDNGHGVSEYQLRIQGLINDFEKYGVSTDKARTETQSLQQILNNMKGMSGQDLITQAGRFEQEFRAVQISVDAAKQSCDNFLQPVSSEKITSLILKIQTFLSKNTAITNEARTELERYLSDLRSGNISSEKWDQINSKLQETANSTRILGRLGSTLKKQWEQAFSIFAARFTAGTFATKIISETTKAISALKEVDTYLTKISKASSSFTSSDLKQIGENAFRTASGYGKSAADYLSAIRDMSLAGYQNAEAMAELSMVVQTAGDMTAETANKMITATDEAYHMGGSIKELTEVLDGINRICTDNALDMTAFSEAMTAAGSTAASSGVDVNELAAALGTMASVTRESGSEAADALESVLLHIRQIADEEAGINAEGLAAYEEACNALGVSLKETVNGVLQARDAMEVLEELSKAYNRLGENDSRKTNLLDSLGDRSAGTQLDALLSQWDTYETMLRQYADGTGTMAAAAEKTADSWEGSLNRLSNTWTDTVGNIANSKAAVTIINGLNGIVTVINKLTAFLGTLGTIGLGAGIAAGIKNVGGDKMCSPVLNMPTITGVLRDTGVFLLSDVKYTWVNK